MTVRLRHGGRELRSSRRSTSRPTSSRRRSCTGACGPGSAISAATAIPSPSSTRPICEAVREAVRPGETGIVLDRDAQQSAVDDHRHRRDRRHRACGRRAALRGLHRVDADLHAADRASGPISSCTRRPNTSTAIPTWWRARWRRRNAAASGIASARSATQIGATLGPFEAWLLMRGMRTLACPRAGAGQDGGDAGAAPGRSSGARRRSLSRPQEPSRPRRRHAPDDRRIRRHAVDPRQRRRAGGRRRRGPGRGCGSARPRSAASKA